MGFLLLRKRGVAVQLECGISRISITQKNNYNESWVSSVLSPFVEKDVVATSLEKRQPVALFKAEIMNVLLSLF